MQPIMDRPPLDAISPTLELGAYEALWLEEGATLRRLADRFRHHPEALPSEFVSLEIALDTAKRVRNRFAHYGMKAFDVCIRGMSGYPQALRDAKNPLELFYYQGWLNLLESPSVAVVGTRKPSEDGQRRARQMTTKLVQAGWTVMSGLAAGIDTEAHTAALAAGGRTIAVIGTPISHVYPRENKQLQDHIAQNHLVISQVPVLRYEAQNPSVNRFFFPERNLTMSALSKATIIIEASETSGTLTQAREALRQGRKLFILESCFERSELTWPARFEKQGAIRVRTFDDIREHLGEIHEA